MTRRLEISPVPPSPPIRDAVAACRLAALQAQQLCTRGFVLVSAAGLVVLKWAQLPAVFSKAMCTHPWHVTPVCGILVPWLFPLLLFTRWSALPLTAVVAECACGTASLVHALVALASSDPTLRTAAAHFTCCLSVPLLCALLGSLRVCLRQEPRQALVGSCVQGQPCISIWMMHAVYGA
jgi:hypothetical protein